MDDYVQSGTEEPDDNNTPGFGLVLATLAMLCAAMILDAGDSEGQKAVVTPEREHLDEGLNGIDSVTGLAVPQDAFGSSGSKLVSQQMGVVVTEEARTDLQV